MSKCFIINIKIQTNSNYINNEKNRINNHDTIALCRYWM